MSARTRASATASLPEIRSALSAAAAGAGRVATAISVVPLDRLVLRVLARDARGDLHPSRVQVGLELLLILAAEAEAVRAHGGLLVADLVAKPGRVSGLVFPPHLPLARVVFEDRFVDHRDAVLDRADRLADAAAAAGLHVRVVGAVRHDVKAGVRTLDPAERALHAGVEVDDRAHGAGGELLEIRVALRHVPLPRLLRLADGNRGDRHPLTHLPPLRHLEAVRDLGVALRDLHLTRFDPRVGLAARGGFQVRA